MAPINQSKDDTGGFPMMLWAALKQLLASKKIAHDKWATWVFLSRAWNAAIKKQIVVTLVTCSQALRNIIIIISLTQARSIWSTLQQSPGHGAGGFIPVA